MKKNFTHRMWFWKLFLFSVLAILSSCGAIPSSSSNQADAGSSIEVDDTGLSDTGPIDMPVTIAKLSSPNSKFITMSLADEGSFNFVGAGDASDTTARAISDPTTTPYVLAYNVTTESYDFFEVGDTGAFIGEIEGSIDDQIILFSVTSNLIESLQASPGIIFSMDSLGTVTVTITNSDMINSAMLLAGTPTGDVMFGINNTDGTYHIWKRNIDGTFPQVVFSDMTDLPLRAVSVGSSTDNTDQSFFMIDTGGNINFATYDATTDLFSKSLLEEDLVSLDPADSEIDQQTDFLIYALDFTHVIVMYVPVGGNLQRVVVLDTAGNMAAIVPPPSAGGPIPEDVFHISYASNLMVVITYVDNSSGLSFSYKLDLSLPSEYANAWDNRTTILENIPAEYETAAYDADTDNYYYMENADDGGNIITRIHPVEGGPNEITQITTSQVFSPFLKFFDEANGKFLLTCSTSDNNLIVIPLDDDSDEVVTPIPLTDSTLIKSCKQQTVTETSDGNVYLQFFTYTPGSTESQLSFIDLKKNAVVGGYFE